MNRYIDADKLISQVVKKKPEVAKARYTEGFNDAIMRVRSMIHSAPTVDVVEVVRCKDCKYFVDEDETDMLGLCTCKRIAIAYNGELYPERDFYCPYGERREE